MSKKLILFSEIKKKPLTKRELIPAHAGMCWASASACPAPACWCGEYGKSPEHIARLDQHKRAYAGLAIRLAFLREIPHKQAYAGQEEVKDVRR